MSALIAAIVIGAGSLWLALRELPLADRIVAGPWQTAIATGSPDADPYTRTWIALNGLLALNRSETVYFMATADSAGQPLDGACRYTLQGPALPARWWSITAYAPDRFLIPNPQNAYSEGATTVTPDAAGTWRIALQPAATDGAWIATAPGPFALTLRLYNPTDAAQADLAAMPFPAIIREGCP